MLKKGKYYRWKDWPKEMYLIVEDIKGHRVYGMTHNWCDSDQRASWSCTKNQEKDWIDVSYINTPLYKTLNT